MLGGMIDVGRALIVVGVVIALVGVVCLAAGKLPWLGHLPGDINVERERVSFHFPIVTCLLVSAVLTLLLNLLFRR